MGDKKCTEEAFGTVAVYCIPELFTGDEADFLSVAFFIEKHKIGRVPCFVCFAIDRIKGFGALNTIE